MKKDKKIYDTVLFYDNPIVRDHRVHDMRVLPGVVFIEMIYRLIEEDFKGKVIVLRNIVFKQPIVVTKEFDRRIEILLTEIKKNYWEVTVISKKIIGNRIIEKEISENAECELYLENKNTEPGNIDIKAIKKSALKVSDMDEIYSYARSVQIKHDVFMKSLGKIYESKNYVLMELHLSDLARQFADRFSIHPTFLDASTFSIGVETMRKKETSTTENKPYIPIFIEEFRAWEKGKDRCYVYTPIHPETEGSGDLIKVDVKAYDASGKQIFIMKGLAVKRIRAKELISELGKISDVIKGPVEIVKPKIKEEKITEEKSKSEMSTAMGDNVKEIIIHELTMMLANVLNMPGSKLDTTVAFYDLGLDSKQLLQVVKDLEAQLDSQLYPTLLFEYSTIQDLSGYLYDKYKHHYENKIVGNKVAPKSQEIEIKPVKKKEFVPKKYVSTGKGKKTIEDIAIIGLSGRYPQAKNLEEFWNNLKEGKDSITEIPKERWDYQRYYDPDKNQVGKSYAKWGGFIEDVDKFDPLFFNISPRDAELMDPQERLFLETAWNTIEDAGYSAEQLSNTSVGVFVGAMYGHYELFGAEESLKGNVIAPNSFFSSIANRVSYYFNFTGPSIALDTMCSSSLTSIHLACRSIQEGECEMAIAGGVNISIHPNKYIFLSQSKFLSTDGHCQSFGVDGDGYVPGEGVGAVLLKPLEKAIADGDHIYGVVKASRLNHGGKSRGYTVPNPEAQADVIEETFAAAEINPKEVNYIEAHGTGTSLGDPIEIIGLTKIFGEANGIPCAIGSVKSNIGHLESAAGVAAVTKVLLQLEHRALVPSLHSENLNPNIDWEHVPLKVQREFSAWSPIVSEQEDGSKKVLPLRAGISSFGAGGSNAHMIIEEAPIIEYASTSKQYYLITLSAKTEKSLQQKQVDLAKWLTLKIAEKASVQLEEISYTLNVGRDHFDYRCALVVGSLEELKEKLEKISQQQPVSGYCEGDASKKSAHSAVFDKVLQITLSEIKDHELNDIEYKKDLEVLADLYVQGYEFDWKILHEEEANKKISLPTYPFRKNRYWIKIADSKMIEAATQISSKSLHPFIDSNISTFEKICFTKNLIGNEFYLVDHKVNDRQVLPGVVYLEMARASAEFASDGKKIQTIKNIFWLNPLFVEKPITVMINLEYTPPNISFSITTNEGENIVTHVKGILDYTTVDKRILSKINIEEIKKRFNKHRSKDELYQFFKEAGLTYGPTFQAIKEMFIGDHEALIILQMPSILKDQAENYVLNPSIVDGALQGIGAIVLSTDKLFLPFSLGKIQVLSPLVETCFVHVIKKSSDQLNFDIQVMDDSGNILLLINDFNVREISTQKTIPKAENIFYYKPVLEIFSLSEQTNKTFVEDTCLIWDAENKWGHFLQKNENMIFVTLGNSFKYINDRQYEMDFDNPEHYSVLFKKLTELNLLPKNLIYFLPFSVQQAELRSEIQQSTREYYRLFYLTRALIEQKIKDEVNFYSVIKNNNLFSKALSGFLKTVSMELPKIKCHLFGLEEVSEAGIHALFSKRSSEEEIMQFNAKSSRSIRYAEVMPSKGYLPLKKQGVYLITGGAGGLGLIFARYLAKSYQAKLLLTGRSMLKEDQKATIASLEKMGAEVLYLSADMTKEEDVLRVVQTVKERYGQLNGIIHSAGVVRDALIIKKTKEEIKQVLAPKIEGTFNLDQATKTESLDFFVLFSSISSIFGNIGQCDYAYANGFMDEFAVYRNALKEEGKRQGRTVSINWPLWLEGGMQVDEISLQLMEKMMGIKPLGTAEGILAFEEALTQDVTQQIVLMGDKSKIEKRLPVATRVIETKTAPAFFIEPVIISEKKSESSIKEKPIAKIQEKITAILAGILKLNADEIMPSRHMSDYGMDSVTLVMLTNELNQYYGLEITPALLFEGKTIEETVYRLYEEYEAIFDRFYQSASRPVSAEPTPTLEINMKQVITKVDKDKLIAKVQEKITAILAGILKLNADEIMPSRHMSDYGMDSVTLVMLTNELNQYYGLEITPALLFEGKTIGETVYRLYEEYEAIFDQFYQSASQTVSTETPPTSEIQVVTSIDVFPSTAEPLINPPAEVISADLVRDVQGKVVKEDIAIIGMSGIFPQSPTLQAFWNNLEAQKSLIVEIPESRWDWKAYYGVGENKTKVKRGGFIEGIDEFDAAFFNISPNEAELMDPQQRIFLQTAWKAVEDAGYQIADLSTIKTGLFVGVSSRDYAEVIFGVNTPSGHVATGNAYSILANRVSYCLNLSGPSETVDTACSSSLVAIHNAIKAIQVGDCDMAIAGGVNALITPTLYFEFTQAGMLAEDGRCKTFDKAANGYVRGEGVGAILLKPLSKALLEGDHIYGVIKGSSTNHGGRVSSLTVPNPNAQAELIAKVWGEAKIDPSTITYIETHGTGTQLGDPIEINGLKKAFQMLQKELGKASLPEGYCGLGAVKTNMGHLEAAAGIGGVIKVLLAIKNKKLPGIVNFKELNPHILIKDSPFYLVTSTREWSHLKNDEGKDIPYRVGISSFGFGGANAHIAIEESAPQRMEEKKIKPYYLVTLSAKTEEALFNRCEDLLYWLNQKENSSIQLSEIAYTLNRGRDHFPRRLAFVVESIDSLKAVLTDAKNKKENPYYFSGTAGKVRDEAIYNKILELTMNELKGESSQDKNTYKKNLLALADLYVKGYTIEWDLLHGDEARKKISLPTYPFAKKRYWVTSKDTIGTQATTVSLTSALHPLIDVNISTLETESFKKTFTGKEFYLADHIVNGSSVLPGVAYLEIARAAASLASPKDQVISLKDIIWVIPIIVKEATPAYIKLIPEENQVSFKITTNDRSDLAEIINAQGKIIFASNNSIVRPDVIDIDAIKKRCLVNQDPKVIYERFKSNGIYYGPSFQVVKALSSNENEAISTLQIPDGISKEANQYYLHPSILDGALQTIMGLIPSNEVENQTYLPFSIDQIEMFSPLPNKAYVYAVKDSGNEVEGLKFQLQVIDEQGRVSVSIKNFIARPLSKSVSIKEEEGLYYYQGGWKKTAIQRSSPPLNANFLLFDHKDEIQSLLKNRYPNNHYMNVHFGDDYKELTVNEYILNPEESDHFEKIFNVFLEKNSIPAYIIYRFSQEELSLPELIKKNFSIVFNLTKALMKQKIKEPIQLIFITEKDFLVTDTISAFTKTVNIEQSKIITRQIIIHQPQNLIDEISADDIYVYYDENDVRYVKSYYEFTPSHKQLDLIKRNGTYLITGGMGGLGLIFSRYLAKNYQAKLILTGRSILKEEQQELLQEIGSLGGEAIYVQADVSKEKDTEKLSIFIKNHLGSLNGIIHSAGIIKDSSILNKTIEDSHDILAPKIFGTINLDTVFKNESLDFFVLFSSVSAVTGNAGQSDYAYGNAFMDAFAQYRQEQVAQGLRHGQTFSINWPLWAEGGMRTDEATRKWMAKALGLTQLSTPDGLEAFEVILNQSIPNQIVLSGNKQKISSLLKKVLINQKIVQENNPQLRSQAIDKSEIKEAVQNYTDKPMEKMIAKPTGEEQLVNITRKQVMLFVSAILKMDISEIDLEEKLSAYGMDSISLVRLSNQLNEFYGLELTASVWLEHNTINRFVNFLVATYTEKISKKYEKEVEAQAKTPDKTEAKTLQKEFKSTRLHLVQGKKHEDVLQSTEAPTKAKLEEELITTEALESASSLLRERNSPSFGQEGLWFIHALNPKEINYNIGMVFRFEGPLNTDALFYACDTVVRHHDSLRMSFPSREGRPTVKVSPFIMFSNNIIDCTAHSNSEQDIQGSINHEIEKEFDKPFDLMKGPLIRHTLLNYKREVNVLIICMNHIISDGWSFFIHLKELSEHYNAYLQNKSLPPVSSEYKYLGFIDAQKIRAEKAGDSHLTYWKHQLQHLHFLNLPTDKPRGIGHPCLDTYKIILDADLVKQLKEFSLKSGNTLFALMFGAFCSLLYRYSGQADFAVGIPFAGREHGHLENAIGFFVNTLPIRVSIQDEMTIASLLEQIKENIKDAFTHQEISLAPLTTQLHLARHPNRESLFQVTFTLNNYPSINENFENLNLDVLKMESGRTRSDILLEIYADDKNNIYALFKYDTTIFLKSTIERMAGHFINIAKACAQNSDQLINELPLLTHEETHKILIDWNQTLIEYPSTATIAQAFEEQVKKTPNKTALVFKKQKLTYAQLNAKANQLAFYFIKIGVKEDTIVAICLDRSIDFIVCLMGILKAGGAYLPLDPSYPKERLQYMLEDSHSSILLTNKHLESLFKDKNVNIIKYDHLKRALSKNPKKNIQVSTHSNNLAYVIYTSGSTGKPKGVAIEQHSVVNMALWAKREFHLTDKEVCTQYSGMSFDASVIEIFPALFSGAALYIVDEEIKQDMVALNKYFEKNKVSWSFLPTPVFELFQKLDNKSLRTMITAGDRLSHYMKKNYKTYNLYGPTENTVWSTTYELEHSCHYPAIGKPIANTKVYILDRFLNPVPIGASGELYVGGEGLAREYLNQPEMTKERFIPNPFDKGKLYKTGDLCRWLADGNIEFIGRIDNQVKIRGFRIELGEIESYLKGHIEVADAAIVVKEDIPGDKRLVAYWYAKNKEKTISSEKLKEYLQKYLPSHMVPSAWVQLDEFPLTPSGKLDRRALPEPKYQTQTKFITDMDSLEKKIADIWANVLHIENVGLRDDFFALGGHSLLAAALMHAIQKEFNTALSLADLFESPTVEMMAKIVRQNRSKRPKMPSAIVPLKTKGNKPAIFAIYPLGVKVSYYTDLAKSLDKDQPLYGLQQKSPIANDSLTLEKLAKKYMKDIQHVQPQGPYYLLGWSMGGVIAHEIAYQLEQKNEKVASVTLLDSFPPEILFKDTVNKDIKWLLAFALELSSLRGADPLLTREEMISIPVEERLSYLFEKAKASGVLPERTRWEEFENLFQQYNSKLKIYQHYNLKKIQSPIALVHAKQFLKGQDKLFKPLNLGQHVKIWETYTENEITGYEINTNHYAILTPSSVEKFVNVLGDKNRPKRGGTKRQAKPHKARTPQKRASKG